MTRYLLLFASIICFLFGLGFLGGQNQNLTFIILGVVFFLLTLSTFGQTKSKKQTPQSQKGNLEEHHLAELQALLTQGKKITAIKQYREFTGSSLKVSKDFVESLVPGISPEMINELEPLPLSSDLEDAIRTIKEHSTIEAVREVRGLTGASLREVKDYVDRL